MVGGGGKSKWPRRIIDATSAAPVPMPKPNAAFVRLKHPRETGVYYCSIRGEWVRKGWTVWKLKEWEAKFTDPDPDGRKWEFFGYTIPLYFEDPEKDLPATPVSPTRDP
jgi:hypothetical protein